MGDERHSLRSFYCIYLTLCISESGMNCLWQQSKIKTFVFSGKVQTLEDK